MAKIIIRNRYGTAQHERDVETIADARPISATLLVLLNERGIPMRQYVLKTEWEALRGELAQVSD